MQYGHTARDANNSADGSLNLLADLLNMRLDSARWFRQFWKTVNGLPSIMKDVPRSLADLCGMPLQQYNCNGTGERSEEPSAGHLSGHLSGHNHCTNFAFPYCNKHGCHSAWQGGFVNYVSAPNGCTAQDAVLLERDLVDAPECVTHA